MTFDADEKSVSDSRPREFVEISHGPLSFYRVAFGQRDIFYAGNTFIATPSARAEIKIGSLNGLVALEISLPSDHALVRRYVAMGSPPRTITATVYRMQLTSGEVQTVWSGFITSLAFGGSGGTHAAVFSVPSRTQQDLQINVPTLLVDTVCTHVLYDTGCQAVQSSHSYAAHVSSVDGRIVVVTFDVTPPVGDQWARGGELVHVTSAERMTIWDQTATTITMEAPIYELHTGDAVQVIAGCDHSLATCGDKFANVVNYGGLPQRPTSNIYLPNGFGIVEQT